MLIYGMQSASEVFHETIKPDLDTHKDVLLLLGDIHNVICLNLHILDL